MLRSAARLFHLEGINAKRWRDASVELITTTYQTGVKLTKDAMQMVDGVHLASG